MPATCAVLLLSPILPGNEGVWNPVWSPDGQAIAFRCLFISLDNVWDYQKEGYDFQYNRSIWGDICMIDSEGRNFRRLTSTGLVSNTAWSPNGIFLAWLYRRSPVDDLWIIKTNGKEGYPFPIH